MLAPPHPGVRGRSPGAGRGEAGVQRAPAEGECTGTMKARRAGGTGAGSPQTPFGRRRPTGSWARAARVATLVACVPATSSVRPAACHLPLKGKVDSPLGAACAPSTSSNPPSAGPSPQGEGCIAAAHHARATYIGASSKRAAAFAACPPPSSWKGLHPS